LRRNVAQALDAAQEYIWLYGEKMDWITWKGTPREKNPTWQAKLPGFLDTLARLRDPRRWAEQRVARLRQAGALTNGVKSSACALDKTGAGEAFRKGVLPAGWWRLAEEKKRAGVFGTETQKGRGDTWSLCAVGVEQGCFGTSTPATPAASSLWKRTRRARRPRSRSTGKRAGAWDWAVARRGHPIRRGGPGRLAAGFGWCRCRRGRMSW
jgi:hypothetical protein